MRKLNVKEGKNWLQILECEEGKSAKSGNEYFKLKCSALGDPRLPLPSQVLGENFTVYIMKRHDWSMETLRRIMTICGVTEPWRLYGSKFIADVVIKNDFVSLRNPRPYTTEEEPEPEPTGINSPSEWPW